MSLQLRDYQEAMYAEARDLRRAGARSMIFQAPTGSGKCLGIDTPVLMYDGRIVPVQDVKIGDLLMGPDSRPRRVLSLACGREAMYRVTPTKGMPYTCNESHILSLKMTGGNKLGYRKHEVVNLSVYSYLRESKTFKHCAKAWRAAVEFGPHWDPLLIPPYILGLWLGDGNSRKFMITSGDGELIEHVYLYAESLGMAVTVEENSENSINLTVINAERKRGANTNALINALDHYNLRLNKHIPHRYKTASRQERLELLAGIIDTDGSFANGDYDISLKSKQLMDDVAFVARSLGFAANPYQTEKTCTNNNQVGIYWRCSISGEISEIPCKIQRKMAGPRQQVKEVLVTGIKVEPIGEDDYYGFEISGNGLFLLGDFTVTHNTVLAATLLRNCVEKGFKAWFLCHRREILRQSLIKLGEAEVPAGIVVAGTPMDKMSPVQVCSIQSLARRHFELPSPDLIVWDECHHVASNTWGAIHAAYPNACHVGLTATPMRLDGAGLGRYFEHLLLGPSVRTLIDQKWLSPYRLFAPNRPNLEGIQTVAGDYNQKQLKALMDSTTVAGDTVKHYEKHVPGQRAIVFMWSVESSIAIAQRFNQAGIPAAHIDGGTDERTRDRAIQMFREGRLLVLTNVDIVSEGFDLPSCGAGFFCRPTQSLTLHLQQMGRVLRPEPGKIAYLFDQASNCRTLGLPDDDREWTLDVAKKKRRKPSDEEAVRVCPKCSEVHALRVRVCTCGYPLVQARDINVDEHAELTELSEADKKKLRWKRLSEQSAAKDMESLIAYARSQGYKNPEVWARIVLRSRREKAARKDAERFQERMESPVESNGQWQF